MCGIVGAVDASGLAASSLVLSGLIDLEYRGYDSFGVVYEVDGNKDFLIHKEVGEVSKTKFIPPQKSVVALGHTRWATHGSVTKTNAHPHLSCDSRFAIVHNGIVENHNQLRDQLVARGHQFVSTTDSEVLAHLIEEYEELDLPMAMHKVMATITGRNAFVIYDQKTKQLAGIAHGSPLLVGTNESRVSMIVSDSEGFADSITQWLRLPGGMVAVLSSSGVNLIDVNGKELTASFKKRTTQKRRLTHLESFMLSEIKEQPDVLRRLADRGGEFTGFISPKGAVYLSGSGSAYHAALFGGYVFLRQKKRAIAVQASEFTHFIEGIRLSDEVLFLSQSGETADVLQAATLLSQQNHPFYGLTNREESQLASAAAKCLFLGVGTERAVLATKSFVGKLASLLLMSRSIEKNALKATADALDIVVSNSYIKRSILPVVRQLSQFNKILIIGRGQLYPVALEIGLKFKEGCYVMVETAAAGEFKHGPLALVDKKTVCLGLISPDDDYELMQSNLSEIQARGAKVITIGCATNLSPYNSIQIPSVDIAGYPLVITVIGQLLSFYLAKVFGINPDKPRNLAKSVTVF